MLQNLFLHVCISDISDISFPRILSQPPLILVPLIMTFTCVMNLKNLSQLMNLIFQHESHYIGFTLLSLRDQLNINQKRFFLTVDLEEQRLKVLFFLHSQVLYFYRLPDVKIRVGPDIRLSGKKRSDIQQACRIIRSDIRHPAKKLIRPNPSQDLKKVGVLQFRQCWHVVTRVSKPKIASQHL